jgi:Tfp pilus assembly protein PilZ
MRRLAEDPRKDQLGGNYLLFEHPSSVAEDQIRSFVTRCIDREADYLRMSGPLVASPTAAPAVPACNLVTARYFGTEVSLAQFVANISEGGAFVRTLRPHAVGSTLYVDLYVPLGIDAYRIPARVMWTRPYDLDDPRGAGMGLEFTSPGVRAAAAIREFVNVFGTEEG